MREISLKKTFFSLEISHRNAFSKASFEMTGELFVISTSGRNLFKTILFYQEISHRNAFGKASFEMTGTLKDMGVAVV
jgi:hypothetical protein